MTILGRGDLAPPRRHGRRRPWRALLVLLLVAALVAGGWYVWRHYIRDDGSDRTALTVPCEASSHPPAPAELKRAKLEVRNGTKRVGLAHRVARRLRQRGVTLLGVGNTGKPAKATVVSYPDDPLAHSVAIAVDEQLAAPARLALAAHPPVVLVIGRDFRGLATPAQAARARQRGMAVAHPSPRPCASS